MMKKKLSLVLALVGLMTLVVSCDNNNDDGVQYWQDVATVVPDNGSYFIRQDDGTTLKPDASGFSNIKLSRAFIRYSILPDSVVGYDHSVRMYSLDYILTKSVMNLDTTNADSIGNDSADKLAMWVGDNYLNIDFTYAVGSDIVHFINLVNNTTITPPSDGATHLEFRHNANGDRDFRRVEGMVAFDLTPYQVAGQDSVNLVIKFNEFNGTKEYPITYKYGASVASGLQSGLPQASTLVKQYH